jgi:predicted  nucleic acid-binding Zn-ribbon protein
VAKARDDAARAARRAEAAASYSEHEIALIEEELGVLQQQASDATVEAAELRKRLDGLTDVAAVDDLVSRVTALQARLDSLEEQLEPAG